MDKENWSHWYHDNGILCKASEWFSFLFALDNKALAETKEPAKCERCAEMEKLCREWHAALKDRLDQYLWPQDSYNYEPEILALERSIEKFDKVLSPAKPEPKEPTTCKSIPCCTDRTGPCKTLAVRIEGQPAPVLSESEIPLIPNIEDLEQYLKDSTPPAAPDLK